MCLGNNEALSAKYSKWITSEISAFLLDYSATKKKKSKFFSKSTRNEKEKSYIFPKSYKFVSNTTASLRFLHRALYN